MKNQNMIKLAMIVSPELTKKYIRLYFKIFSKKALPVFEINELIKNIENSKYIEPTITSIKLAVLYDLRNLMPEVNTFDKHEYFVNVDGNIRVKKSVIQSFKS